MICRPDSLHGEHSAVGAPEVQAYSAYNGLGNDERDSILLTGHADLQNATLVIDDHLVYLVSDRVGRRKRFLLDIIVDLVQAGTLSRMLAIGIVDAIRSRYPVAFVQHTMLLLRR